MSGVGSFLVVPVILFLVVVVPLWLILHYRSLRKDRQGLNEDDREVIEEMLETVDQMVDRIEVLESILDESHPKWRKVKARAARE